jgi:hypothetical protein
MIVSNNKSVVTLNSSWYFFLTNMPRINTLHLGHISWGQLLSLLCFWIYQKQEGLCLLWSIPRMPSWPATTYLGQTKKTGFLPAAKSHPCQGLIVGRRSELGWGGNLYKKKVY